MIKLRSIIAVLFIATSTLMASTFYPAPTDITSLSANNLTSGTVPLPRLSSSVVTSNYKLDFSVNSADAFGGINLTTSGQYGAIALRSDGQDGMLTLSSATPAGGVAHSGGRVIINSYAPVQVSPSIQCVGSVEASGFSGDGSSLTGLTIGQISGLQATLDAKQPSSSALSSISGLNVNTGNMLYTTGTNKFAKTPVADMGRILIAVPSVASFRTVLGLSTVSNVEFGGLVGTKTNNRATTGNVGEYFEVYFTGVSVGAGIGDLCSQLVPTGDWDVSALVCAYNSTAPAFTLGVGISPYGSGDDTDLNLGDNYTEAQFVALVAQKTTLTIPKYRVSNAANTRYYLKYTLSYAGTSFTMSGKLFGRRVR